MKLRQLLEAKQPRKLVVVYGGRFQPFHKGHYAAYKWLCEKFGKANVWLATSNKTSYKAEDPNISPFTFKDKQEIIVGLYGIPANRIVKCKNPTFSPKEIFKLYKDYDIVYIAAVGEKDETRYAASDFFIPLEDKYNEKKLYTIADGHGYYVPMPMQIKGISGTVTRDALLNDRDTEAVFKKYFGKYDPMIDALITARLKEIK